MNSWKIPEAVDTALLDPYFRWALSTRWRGISHWDGLSAEPTNESRAAAVRRIRLLVQASPAEVDDALPSRKVDCPPCYRVNVDWKHFTATLDFTDANVSWMRANSRQTHWKLAIPLRDAETRARAHRIGYYGPDREASSLRRARGIPNLPTAKRAEMAGLDAAIAVIDFGCPFLNQRFTQDPDLALNPHGRDGAAPTRIHAFWDQGAEPLSIDGQPWQSPEGFDYGREIRATTIDAIRAKIWGSRPEFDEQEAYERIGHLVAYDDARRRIWRATHGAHVLDLAGGSKDPLADDMSEVDAAGKAPLIFVQLPSQTAADASGASLGAHLLDAVHYVLAQCKPNAKIVITISYGSHAGPHEGLSMIEKALSEVLDQRSNLQIVLAAGNAGAADCHQRRLVRKDRSALWRFELVPGDSTDSFVECWYPRPREGLRLQWRARSADWQWSDWVSVGEQAELRGPGSELPLAMLRHDAHVPGVDGKCMALLAVAPTAPRVDDSGPLAPPGRWELEARLEGQEITDKDQIVVDAWIERDDPGELATDLRQSHFVGAEPGDRRNTLSSIAGVEQAFIVQGHRLVDGLPPAYVSMPGERRPDLLLSAVCEVDDGLPGLRAAAVRSVDSFMMAGTSVAAPVAARQLFNLMSKSGAPSRQQLHASLLALGKTWRGHPCFLPGFAG